ncbi:MAG: sialate O-acetylesterase [Lachnospiraceae bacterium]|nr:sialate O-acetylesterase [Lachnospiraceae bacterium]
MKMKFKRNIFLSTLLVLALIMQTLFVPASAVKAEDSANGPDPNFHIYIAFGQSNMAGSSASEVADLEIPDNYYMMQTTDGNQQREVGEWYQAKAALTNSNEMVCLGDYFGFNISKLKQEENPDVKIGVIVVAVAGISIKGFDKDTYESYLAGEADWMKNIAAQFGGNPYQRIIDVAQKAQEDGVIKGIIMHQGETDGGDMTWSQKVKKVYDDMITDLELGDNIPLLAGQLLTGNSHINKLTEESDNFHVISCEGLVGGSDGLHFTATEKREYGLRYAEKMIEVEPQYTFTEPVYEWSADNTKLTAKRTCNELASYVEEETVDVTKTITKEAAVGVEGVITYTSADFTNSAFVKQTKTETIPALAAPSAEPTSPSIDDNAPAVEQTLKLSAVKCKKNTKKITGKVSKKGAVVKIKVGKKAAKKAIVKGKKFTLKLSSKLVKKTKIAITVTKKNYKTLKKTYTVK